MIQKIIFVLFIFLCNKIAAQEPIHYTTKQGLPSNHIYDIAEDANGFMWFATNRGLVKYNGEKFKTFTIKDGLPNNDTWLLQADLQGRLWYFSISNYQGYIKNDSIYKFPVQDKRVITPRIIFQSKKELWINSDNGNYKEINDTLKTVGNYNRKSQHLYFDDLKKAMKNHGSFTDKDTNIMHIAENEHAVLKGKNLFFFDSLFQFIKKIKVDLPTNYRNRKISNVGLLYNQIYYYGIDSGVLFINFKTKTTKFFSFKELVNVVSTKYFRAKGLADEIQISIPGHLLIFDFTLKLKKTYSFPKELSRISHRDSKGNIWLADFTNGISLIPNTQVHANYYLQNKKVQKINKIDGDFYAGVNDVGFYKLDESLNAFQKKMNLTRQNGEIYQIEKLKNHKTYFVSSSGSFFKKENSYQPLLFKNAPQSFYTSTGSFKNSIFFDNQLYLINGGTIFKATKNLKKVINKEALLHSAIYKNQLYYGGADGLFVLKNDSLYKQKSQNEILQVSISSLLANKDNLFVGTDGRGVYIYNRNEIIQLKNTDGFSIQKIIQKENTLWLATNKGVHKVTFDTSDVRNSKIINSFYESDGLLQNNTNDMYVEDSLLYAASDVGIAKVNIKNTVYKQQPKLYFKTKKDTLTYANKTRENISITFGLQDYTNQEYVNYQYRVLPTQQNWTKTQTKILNFSNLSPGFYQLEVKATDQHFNQTIATQYINVIPEWWQTTTAKIGFGVFAILGFLGFIKILKSRIQEKEEAKAQLDKKIAGLELQALRSQMNPHFVHNSLNAIQYYIQRNEVELSEKYLVKFSKLVRLFFEYSRKQHISIKDEVMLLNNYLQIEKLRFEDKLSYTIEVDESIDIEEQLIPSMMLQPIVENAVNHGLFHKKENGLVTVVFKKIKENSFQVIVEDNGIGIIKSKEMFKDSSRNYQSKSTDVLEERLGILQQSNNWKIDYKIQDLSEVNTANGTRVTLIFNQPAL
tara:strand:+ start:4866 stop:7784 length:2919 start_codon:yes stop_codon:yes gene_type:complete